MFCNSELLAMIMPTVNLTKFHYYATSCDDLNTLRIWYNYMSRKYTNVAEFYFGDECWYDMDIDTARRLYQSGFLQMLQFSGPSMSDHVPERIPNGINVFERLDNGYSKTTRLVLKHCEGETLFQFLAHSNQAKHVQKLFLEGTKIGTSDSHQSLTSLIRLDPKFSTIFVNTEQIDFTSYLNGLPSSLQYFSVERPILEVEVGSTLSTNITILSITCYDIGKELGDVLSNCFPQLETLNLTGNVSEDINITVQNPKFKRASFHRGDSDLTEYVFSFQSASQADPQYYLNRLIGVELTTHDNIADLPILTFVSPAEQECKVKYKKSIQVKSLRPSSPSLEDEDMMYWL